MPTETTATLLVGPLDTRWGAGVFAPDHALQLREGSKATWTVASIAPVVQLPFSVIRPASPENLLAVGLLGFAALVAPDLLDGSTELRDVVHREPDGVSVDELDPELARRVFAWSSDLVDGLVTVLSGSSITDEELALAKTHGLRIAIADDRSSAAGGGQ